MYQLTHAFYLVHSFATWLRKFLPKTLIPSAALVLFILAIALTPLTSHGQAGGGGEGANQGAEGGEGGGGGCGGGGGEGGGENNGDQAEAPAGNGNGALTAAQAEKLGTEELNQALKNDAETLASTDLDDSTAATVLETAAYVSSREDVDAAVADDYSALAFAAAQTTDSETGALRGALGGNVLSEEIVKRIQENKSEVESTELSEALASGSEATPSVSGEQASTVSESSQDPREQLFVSLDSGSEPIFNLLASMPFKSTLQGSTQGKRNRQEVAEGSNRSKVVEQSLAVALEDEQTAESQAVTASGHSQSPL